MGIFKASSSSKVNPEGEQASSWRLPDFIGEGLNASILPEVRVHRDPGVRRGGKFRASTVRATD